jgi:sigma-E factor negative regulatory protein RseC
MREQGKVVSFADGTARIKFERNEACARCGLCRVGLGTEPLLEVETEKPLSPGDKVTVEIKGPGLLGASILVFLVPLIFFLIGALVGRMLAVRLSLQGKMVDVMGLVVGASVLGVVFALLRVYERRIRKKKSFEVKIVEVQD